MKDLSGLKRYPHRRNETLQAWDAADELIIQHVEQEIGDLAGKRVLILNDSFGALSRSLSATDVTTYTDSYVSSKAIELNTQGRCKPIHRLNELNGVYDLVLARIPKNLSFFEDTLCRLSHHLRPGAELICGYMVKHQAKTSFDLLNRLIGETRTSLAKKKARLIFARFERSPVDSPYPLRVPLEGFEQPFIHHSNLFSREKLDIGTRFLLEHLPDAGSKAVLDLGCANGIVGIALKRRNPDARLIFSDDSQMALQSAQTNYQIYFPGDEAEFLWLNCYEGQEAESLDLVVCNPPFHQGNTLGDFIAWQMFKDSHRALRPGGTLRVIGNQHLQYHHALKRIFGNSEIIASNPKFMIVDSVK